MLEDILDQAFEITKIIKYFSAKRIAKQIKLPVISCYNTRGMEKNKRLKLSNKTMFYKTAKDRFEPHFAVME